MYEIQSPELVFAVINGNRHLIGDIVTAAKMSEAPELLQAAITAYMQRDLRSPELDAVMAENAQLKTELSALVITDWSGLMDDLKVAGFNRWLADAGNTNPDLLVGIARLYAAAKEGNRKAVIDEYSVIADQYPPSIEDRIKWQAVLNSHKIPRSLLAFTKEDTDDSN